MSSFSSPCQVRKKSKEKQKERQELTESLLGHLGDRLHFDLVAEGFLSVRVISAGSRGVSSWHVGVGIVVVGVVGRRSSGSGGLRGG